MIEAAATTQIDYLLAKPEAEKKAFGQYYTGSKVAEYMASMVKPVRAEKVRILDAGAGAGILAVCAALQCLENGNDSVHAVLYELDENAIPLLSENMQSFKEYFLEKGGKRHRKPHLLKAT